MTGPEELLPADVLPQEAIAFFRAKGYRIGFSWEDVFRGEHARWFTVAKAMTRDVLEDIREAVDRAIAEGITLETFKAELRPKLEAKGWWGRKQMIDPATGQFETVQLGSPRRLQTIFRTNVRTAYAAGKWERIQRTKRAFPFLEYSSVMDGRERPEHHAWDGTILPVDHPWWDTHTPPCDWECRCDIVARSQRMLDRKGLKVDAAPPQPNPSYQAVNKRTGEVFTLEKGIGKGWDYNVGKEYLRGLAPGPLPESFDQRPDEIGAAAQLTPKQTALVDRFLAAFDIAPGKEAIWIDRDGWPLSIGRGWFIGPAGRIALPRGAAGVAIDRIAAAIVEADSIRWVWVRALDGRVLLMRRYARTSAGVTTLVDVGREGWRWVSGRAEEIAAANQPRDARGRWARVPGARLPDPLPMTQMRPGGRTSDAAATAASFLGRPLKHSETGLTAQVSKRTLGKMMSQSAVGKSTSPADHASAIANLDTLFLRSRRVESGPDLRGEPTIKAIHRYHARMETPRGELLVRMMIKETTSDSNPNVIYTVETRPME